MTLQFSSAGHQLGRHQKKAKVSAAIREVSHSSEEADIDAEMLEAAILSGDDDIVPASKMTKPATSKKSKANGANKQAES